MTSSPDIELQELELLLNSIACEIQGLGLIEEQELEGDKSPSKNSPNESYVISIPVSYTHLDVYKRQDIYYSIELPQLVHLICQERVRRQQYVPTFL